MGCSAFNLVVFLIFIHDYKFLTERSMSQSKGQDVIIPINQFIPWVFFAAPLLGPLATIAIIKNLIIFRKPFNVNNDENLHT